MILHLSKETWDKLGLKNTMRTLHDEFLQELNKKEVKLLNTIPKEFEIRAMDEFIKTSPDIAKSKIRAAKAVKSQNVYELKLNTLSTLTVKNGSGYAKREMSPPMICKVDSLYVGKRGDVIFQLKRNNGEIVEMKLRDAILLLDGFWGLIHELLKDVAQEMMAHFKELEIQNEKGRRDRLLKERQEAAERKAAKYKGKPFGAW